MAFGSVSVEGKLFLQIRHGHNVRGGGRNGGLRQIACGLNGCRMGFVICVHHFIFIDQRCMAAWGRHCILHDDRGNSRSSYLGQGTGRRRCLPIDKIAQFGLICQGFHGRDSYRRYRAGSCCRGGCLGSSGFVGGFHLFLFFHRSVVIYRQGRRCPIFSGPAGCGYFGNNTGRPWIDGFFQPRRFVGTDEGNGPGSTQFGHFLIDYFSGITKLIVIGIPQCQYGIGHVLKGLCRDGRLAFAIPDKPAGIFGCIPIARRTGDHNDTVFGLLCTGGCWIGIPYGLAFLFVMI
eukprot:scaffold620_cov169-Amphora_coffeaeformis.AAC.20